MASISAPTGAARARPTARAPREDSELAQPRISGPSSRTARCRRTSGAAAAAELRGMRATLPKDRRRARRWRRSRARACTTQTSGARARAARALRCSDDERAAPRRGARVQEEALTTLHIRRTTFVALDKRNENV